IGQSWIVERTAAARSGGIPQAAQALFLVRGNRIRLGGVTARREPLQPALELVAHPPHAVGLGGCYIAPLAGILREVVQLGLGAGDQFPVVLGPPAQSGPMAI